MCMGSKAEIRHKRKKANSGEHLVNLIIATGLKTISIIHSIQLSQFNSFGHKKMQA